MTTFEKYNDILPLVLNYLFAVDKLRTVTAWSLYILSLSLSPSQVFRSLICSSRFFRIFLSLSVYSLLTFLSVLAYFYR